MALTEQYFFLSYQIPVKKVHIYDHWLKLLGVAFVWPLKKIKNKNKNQYSP